MIHIVVDTEAKATYIKLRDDKSVRSMGIGGAVVDLNEDGQACGIEIFDDKLRIDFGEFK